MVHRHATGLMLDSSKRRVEKLNATYELSPELSRKLNMPTFKQVYETLSKYGPGFALSNRGTEYRIEAKNGKIMAFPRSGRLVVHEDCWLNNKTCQGTRAGGIYNGPYSIIDWYRENIA